MDLKPVESTLEFQLRYQGHRGLGDRSAHVDWSVSPACNSAGENTCFEEDSLKGESHLTPKRRRQSGGDALYLKQGTSASKA